MPAKLGSESDAVDLGKCYASMVQDAGWNAVVRLWVGKYAEWSQNSFHERWKTQHHIDSQLRLNQTLRQQGIVGKFATLSCTYVPTDLYAAGYSIHGQYFPLIPEPETTSSLEGVTQIAGTQTANHFGFLPQSLESLTFGDTLNSSLAEATLTSSLQILTFGSAFNQSMDHVKLQSNLRNLTFGYCFNQSMD